MPPQRTYFISSEESGFKNYSRSVSIIPGQGFEFARSLEEEDAIIESEPVAVHMVCRDHIDATDETDPGFIFGRMGFSGADFTAQLTQTIDLSNTPTVHCTTVAGLAAGDIVHIGQEAIEVGAVDVATKTFTVAASGRGRLATTKARHVVSNDDGVFPLVTKPAVFFRGRRAVIYEASLGVNGELPSDSEWIERFRGFVASEPEFSTDGGLETVTLNISPLTAALDRPLSHRSGKLRLHPSIHSFDGLHCEHIAFFESVKVSEYFFVGIHEPATGPVQINGKFYTTLANSPLSPGQGVAQVFDGLLPYADNPDSSELYPYKHPRRFVVSVNERLGLIKNGVIIDRDGDHVLIRDVDGPLQNDGDNFVGADSTVMANDSHNELRLLNVGQSNGADFASGTPASVVWPKCISSAIEAQNFDSDELFHGLFQIFFADQARVFSFLPNYKYPIPNAAQLEAIPITLPTPPRATLTIARDARNYQRTLHDSARGVFGWLGAAARGDVYRNMPNAADAYKAGLKAETVHPITQIPRTVLDFFDGGDADKIDLEVAYDRRPTIANTQTRESIGRRVPVKTPQSFYVPGPRFSNAPVEFFGFEKFITFDKDPGAPPNGQILLDVSKGGDGDPFMQLLIGPATEINVDNQTAFRCEVFEGKYLSDDELIIADFGGPIAQRPLFSPAVRFAPSVSVGQMLLQLLTSATGAGVTSSDHDVLPLGAGLTDKATNPLGSDIDVDTFLSIAEPVGLEFGPLFRSGDTILDIMRGILLSVGYVLDTRVDDSGRCRLSAVKVGVPSVLDVVDSISDADIAETPTPSSPARTSIRNIFNFSANFDLQGEPQLEQEIKDTASIETFGEADKIDIELQGATINLDPGSVLAALQPIFSKLRAELSFPRRLYRFGVRAGLAARMRVGGVYRISSGQLRGDKGPGVVDAVCRLRSIDAQGFEPVANVEFVNFGFAGSGWAPSLAVIATNGATLTVRTSDYRPESRQEDLSGFVGISAGEKVRIFTGDDPGAGTSHDVSAVDLNLNTITLAADPGLAAPADGHPVIAYVTAEEKNNAALIHADYAYVGLTRII